MDKKQTAMPAVAGSLAIADGALKVLSLLGMLGFGLFMAVPSGAHMNFSLLLLPLIGLPLLVLAVLAINGGIFAIQRRKWNWALTGSIAALLPFSLLGLASLILVALAKEEFE
jgi:hypothetical protein